MDEKEFVAALPSYTTCEQCGSYVVAPIWRVSRFERNEWLALNVVACSKCGNIMCAAAGSTEAAAAEASTIRIQVLRREFGIIMDKKR